MQVADVRAVRRRGGQCLRADQSTGSGLVLDHQVDTRVYAHAVGNAPAQHIDTTAGGHRRRRPERTLWYRIVQTHLETWLELASGEGGFSVDGSIRIEGADRP